jgi:regulator of sigma E protease
MNFVLAWGIYSAMFAVKPKNVQLPVVGQVIQETLAFKAGIQAGDVILRVDDAKITNWGELIVAKELASGREADVLLTRGDKLVRVRLAPAERWGLIADGSKTELRKKGIFGAMYSGLRETYVQSKTLLVVLKQIVTGERSSKQLGSFITIAEVSGKAMAVGFLALLSIIALLSVNLAIINLLPLPVLDGGYLLILIIEAITRRKLGGRGMEIAIICGWILIMCLFALTMWNDLARVFGLN